MRLTLTCPSPRACGRAVNARIERAGLSPRLLGAAAACLALAATGVAVAAAGVPALRSDLVARVRAATAVDSPSSPAFPSWASSADPGAARVTVTFHVYNITNALDVTNFGATPAVAEIPPLTYELSSAKMQPQWTQDLGEVAGDFVSYTPYAGYVPADAATEAGQEAVVFAANLPLLLALSSPVAAYVIATTPMLAARYLNDESSLWVQRPAREILFGWDNDPFLHGAWLCAVYC